MKILLNLFIINFSIRQCVGMYIWRNWIWSTWSRGEVFYYNWSLLLSTGNPIVTKILIPPYFNIQIDFEIKLNFQTIFPFRLYSYLWIHFLSSYATSAWKRPNGILQLWCRNHVQDISKLQNNFLFYHTDLKIWKDPIDNSNITVYILHCRYFIYKEGNRN